MQCGFGSCASHILFLAAGQPFAYYRPPKKGIKAAAPTNRSLFAPQRLVLGVLLLLDINDLLTTTGIMDKFNEADRSN